MTKKYINIAFVLISAWTVYGHCQDNLFLRDIAAVFIVLSFLLRLKTGRKQYSLFDRIPLSVIIVISLIAGFMWRNIYPPPEDIISPFPAITAALQSGSIFASLIIWLKPFTNKNAYRLFFLAWLTVALSVNVPFTGAMLILFSSFCIIAIAVVILHSMHKPKDRKHIFRYYRDFIFFSILLIALSTGLFYGIAKSIVIFDDAFMNLISDYVMPRSYTNFLRIEPLMNLSSPGRSAWDKRPVLEIESPNEYGFYLKTQIFDQFDNGTWAEQDNIVTFPLSDDLSITPLRARMTMFTSFEYIVPSPSGVEAAKGNRPLSKSRDNVVYSEDEQRTRIVTFSLTPKNVPARLSPSEHLKYTAIPAEIDSSLRKISAALIGSETNPAMKADLLSNYFSDNFGYSLNVDFRGNNAGLISMILKKRPAYCTYFASALTMLLRAQDIPARVATGFLVDEKIDKKKNLFLARISDAHAWVEVLIEVTDPATGLASQQWTIFDPTPAEELAMAFKRSALDPSVIAENIWLSILRLSAFLENLNKDKLKRNTLIVLILIMMFINAKKIIGALRPLTALLFRKSLLKKEKNNPLRSVYQRYERYLKAAFDETRKDHNTDKEVIDRLTNRPQIPIETVAKMASFVSQYHSARFGFKEDIALEKIIRGIEKDMKK